MPSGPNVTIRSGRTSVMKLGDGVGAVVLRRTRRPVAEQVELVDADGGEALA